MTQIKQNNHNIQTNRYRPATQDELLVRYEALFGAAQILMDGFRLSPGGDQAVFTGSTNDVDNLHGNTYGIVGDETRTWNEDCGAYTRDPGR